MKKIISIPPNYFYLCVFLNIILFFFLPDLNIIPDILSYTGIVFIFIGFYLISSSYFILKKNNTPEKFLPSKCVVQLWVYKISRNPMYLWWVIFLLWFALLLKNIIGLVSPIIFFLIINNMFIPYEEEKMEKELWEKYLQYKKKVRCWL